MRSAGRTSTRTSHKVEEVGLLVVALSQYRIHVIEDSQADYLALRRALAWAAESLEAQLHLSHYLTSQEAYDALVEGNRPDLIFVDINLRGESGLAFLRRVKSDGRIIPCPKVILTTSTCEADVKESFREGAAGYLVKPLSYQDLRVAVHTCLEYWFVASRRPESHANDDGEGQPPPRC